MSTYTMAEIYPKNGSMRDIHEEVLGCPCYIVDLIEGRRGMIKFLPRYESGGYHRLHTSNVIRFSPWGNDEKEIKIETENTIYIMKLIKEEKRCDN